VVYGEAIENGLGRGFVA